MKFLMFRDGMFGLLAFKAIRYTKQHRDAWEKKGNIRQPSVLLPSRNLRSALTNCQPHHGRLG